jgi:hypothetical protein
MGGKGKASMPFGSASGPRFTENSPEYRSAQWRASELGVDADADARRKASRQGRWNAVVERLNKLGISGVQSDDERSSSPRKAPLGSASPNKPLKSAMKPPRAPTEREVVEQLLGSADAAEAALELSSSEEEEEEVILPEDLAARYVDISMRLYSHIVVFFLFSTFFLLFQVPPAPRLSADSSSPCRTQTIL